VCGFVRWCVVSGGFRTGHLERLQGLLGLLPLNGISRGIGASDTLWPSLYQCLFLLQSRLLLGQNLLQHFGRDIEGLAHQHLLGNDVSLSVLHVVEQAEYLFVGYSGLEALHDLGEPA